MIKILNQPIFTDDITFLVICKIVLCLRRDSFKLIIDSVSSHFIGCRGNFGQTVRTGLHWEQILVLRPLHTAKQTNLVLILRYEVNPIASGVENAIVVVIFGLYILLNATIFIIYDAVDDICFLILVNTVVGIVLL